MNYKMHQHLIGLPYKSGDQDCYGLALRYYREVYGVQLTNFARPEGWWNHSEMDLINQFLEHDGWDKIGLNIKLLCPGDGLVFSLVGGKANHVGIYVGNGLFIHHVLGRFSAEDALLQKWTSKLLMIVRHPSVAELGKGMGQKTQIETILPRHFSEKLKRFSS